MQADYGDIVRRVRVAPQWWDGHGVPRFDPFRPQDSPNVYAEEVALLRIECAGCGAMFLGEVNGGLFQGTRVLETLLREGGLAYGDPPRHGCGGDAMLAITREVVEFWRRNQLQVFRRAKWLEGVVRQPERMLD